LKIDCRLTPENDDYQPAPIRMKQPAEDYKGYNLIFVVGCPRSGTTWLQRLLASHPKVHSGEESHVFSMYVGPQMRVWKTQRNTQLLGGERHLVGPPAYFLDQEFVSILRDYAYRLLSPVLERLAPAELFIEKTPSHALFISEIRELLPEARFIHIVRDPRDVVASLLAAAKTWGSDWAPKSATAAAEMWVEHVHAVKEAARNLSKDKFHEVSYEELSRFPEETLKNVSKFLGLDWSDQGIAAAIEANCAESMRDRGTPIPLYGEIATRSGNVSRLPRGFIRRARPGGWRKDLSFRNKFRVWRIVWKPGNAASYRWCLLDWF
jgi:LPS sulfotransferase NodH